MNFLCYCCSVLPELDKTLTPAVLNSSNTRKSSVDKIGERYEKIPITA